MALYVSVFAAQTCTPSLPIIGLCSLIAGTISLLTEVLLYVWLEESNSVKITLSAIGLFVMLPFFYLIPHPGGSNKRRSIFIS